MKVFIGADHQGFHLRNELLGYLKRAGYDVVDDGDEKFDQEDDYPIFATKVAKDILTSEDKQAKGILLCGSGQGMCITANRFRGIRACLGYDQASIRSSRNDDDANILCLPASSINKNTLNVLVETFLNTPFSHVGRYQRRIKEIDEI